MRLMVDIETLSTAGDAAVVSIGAVRFSGSDNKFMEPENQFYARIAWQPDCEAGGRIDPATLRWWLEQDPRALAELTAKPRLSPAAALRELNRFAQGCQELWANGPEFDAVILQSMHRRHGVEWTLPKFWQWQSVRTAKLALSERDLATVSDVTSQLGGVAHNALHDALKQTMLVSVFLQSRGV